MLHGDSGAHSESRQITLRRKRLFRDDAQAAAFTLAHTASTQSGVLITRYVRSDDVRTGAFEEA
jgi:hypothetical protein